MKIGLVDDMMLAEELRSLGDLIQVLPDGSEFRCDRDIVFDLDIRSARDQSEHLDDQLKEDREAVRLSVSRLRLYEDQQRLSVTQRRLEIRKCQVTAEVVVQAFVDGVTRILFAEAVNTDRTLP